MLPVDNQLSELYEINDDPKRKEFLDDLFLFMQKRGTPINRLPIMAKSVLDLYELYNLVIARGGLVDVINKKLWQEIIKGLHLPSSITSAAFTLRTQYMKYLYPYECEKKNLSTPAELQAAIDGNRREGRRSSYGQFDSPSVQRSPIAQGIQQMSPLSLVTHVSQQQQHRGIPGAPNVAQLPNILPAEFEQRMLDYIRMFQPREMNREQSPEQTITREALNTLEMSRFALWNMYNNNNASPPNSLNTSPPEMQRLVSLREALNLSESPPHPMAIKREREHPMDFTERAGARDFHSGIPPAKRSNNNSIAAVAVAQLQQQQQHQHQQLLGHGRSLSPQKLNLSSHDEDDAHSDVTPINLRGENGLRPHDDDIAEEEEEEEEDEEMSIAEEAHPLALNRITEHAAALAAVKREQEQVNHLASLNLSLLERERCSSADKLKRQQQQLQLEQLQREQLLHHQQAQQELQRERERERELQREREWQLQKQQAQKQQELNLQQQQQQQQLLLQQQQQQQQQQQEQHEQTRQNGDRLSGAGMETGSNNTSTSSDHQNRSGSVNESFSPNSKNSGTTTGMMGMQFKLISRGDPAKGDQQLVVSMEFNGVQYEGVLFANPSSSPGGSSSSTLTPPGGNHNRTSNPTNSTPNASSNPVNSPLLMTAPGATGNSGIMPCSSSSPAGSSSSHSSSTPSSNSAVSPAGSSLISPAKTATSSIGGDDPMASMAGNGLSSSGGQATLTTRPLVSYLVT